MTNEDISERLPVEIVDEADYLYEIGEALRSQENPGTLFKSRRMSAAGLTKFVRQVLQNFTSDFKVSILQTSSGTSSLLLRNVLPDERQAVRQALQEAGIFSVAAMQEDTATITDEEIAEIERNERQQEQGGSEKNTSN